MVLKPSTYSGGGGGGGSVLMILIEIIFGGLPAASDKKMYLEFY